ncbi:heterokaryon incompatibility protein-domain-containing protein, partial [Hyaloscypha sp. PMI_1271]
MDPHEALAQDSSPQDTERPARQDEPAMNKEEEPVGDASQQPREQPQPLNEEKHSTNALYSNLKDTDEIRLLYLEPKASGENINCELKHARLSNLPKYEALSYMWGPKDARTEQCISIDNSNFCVRENLWLALQHLRLEIEIRVLWIDAICINQHETQERNHQVSQMGIIFKQAAMVIVWLGDADDISALAFRFLYPGEGHAYIIQTDDPATSLEGNHKLKVIETIFLKDYWRRLWIIQEFLMARDYMLQCGNNTCTRFRLCYFLDAIRQILKYPPTNLVLSKERAEIARRISQTIPARLVQLRAKGQGGYGSTFSEDHTSELVPQPLFNLYAEYKAAECHDPRDRIFGLRSLASACCKEEIPVNYSLSWGEVLRTLIRHQTSHPSIAPKGWRRTPQSAPKEFQEFYGTLASISRDFKQENSSSKFAFAINNFVERIEEVNLSTRTQVRGYIRG